MAAFLHIVHDDMFTCFDDSLIKSMNMKKIIQVIALLSLSFMLSRCEPSSVTVGARLDAPYYERPVQPYPDYVWIDGDWYWQNGHYVYRNGYWAAPRRNTHWQTGIWIQHGSGWRWQRGRWRH